MSHILNLYLYKPIWIIKYIKNNKYTKYTMYMKHIKYIKYITDIKYVKYIMKNRMLIPLHQYKYHGTNFDTMASI